jgi:N-sulfoglucosamine sulfohydrolase
MSDRSLTRRQLLRAAALGVSAAALARAAEARGAGNKRPNILMITCHDLGQHLGCYGVKTVRSPNIDALAARGCRFERYFAAAPTCSPSRGVMLTGRYPQSNGLMGLTHAPWWWKLNDGERHLAALLAEAGYDTTLIGLQHVAQGDPKRLGYRTVLSPGRKAGETVAAAKELLHKARPDAARPRFVKVGFFEVHRAGGSYEHREPDTAKGLTVPPYLKPTEAIRDDLARFQADVHALDGHVGEILSALAASQIADNTLVIFTADHGIAYPGAKWSLREAGLSIPLILHQPGTTLIGAKVHRELMSNVDFLPTLLDWIGVRIPANVQGVSFKDVLLGRATWMAQPPRRYVFAQRVSHALRDNTSRSVRDERYKLIRYFEQGRSVVFPTDAVPADVSRHVGRPKRRGGARPFVQLYDLEKDPHELNDVGGRPEYADVRRRLSRRLHEWMKQVDDPILKGPIATPYYRKAMQSVADDEDGEGKR